MKWAVLVNPADRPYPLNLRHNDYLWPMSYIPRSWTAWISNKPPRQLLGSNPPDHHTDIPLDGTWSLAWPLHFAITLKSGLFFHMGLRFDYNDSYYNIDINWPKYHA